MFSNSHIDVALIGITDYRNTHQPFGIKAKDRLQHIYVIGKTGVGKSTLLQNMAIADIKSGNGLAVIDPHGDVAESLLSYIPASCIQDVIYFNAQIQSILLALIRCSIFRRLSIT